MDNKEALREVETFLRNMVAASPAFGDRWTVVNIESAPKAALLLDLDDGTTIRLDYQRYGLVLGDASLRAPMRSFEDDFDRDENGTLTEEGKAQLVAWSQERGLLDPPPKEEGV